MLNIITLTGRLTADPELRYTASERAVANATLAVQRNYTNSDGERETDFIPLVFWSGLAELVAERCHKGSLIGISGRLEISRYESNKYMDEDGNPATINGFRVVVSDFTFLEPRASEDESEVQETIVEVKEEVTPRRTGKTAAQQPKVKQPPTSKSGNNTVREMSKTSGKLSNRLAKSNTK